MPNLNNLWQQNVYNWLQGRNLPYGQQWQQTAYNQAAQDIGNTLREEFNRRGMWNSGAYDRTLADALARSRANIALQAQQGNTNAIQNAMQVAMQNALTRGGWDQQRQMAELQNQWNTQAWQRQAEWQRRMAELQRQWQNQDWQREAAMRNRQGWLNFVGTGLGALLGSPWIGDLVGRWLGNQMSGS